LEKKQAIETNKQKASRTNKQEANKENGVRRNSTLEEKAAAMTQCVMCPKSFHGGWDLWFQS
jgi:hypothetical protein